MRKALTIAGKELSIYLTTPRAYVAAAGLTGVLALFFVAMVERFNEVQALARAQGWSHLPPEAAAYKNLTDGVVIQLWGAAMVVILFVAPFLSMRLLAEERRQRTFEWLLSAAVRPVELVAGKYLAGVGAISAVLVWTLVFPLLLAALGTGGQGGALEWPTVLLGFFALWLWAATCVAIGLFFSAVTRSQAVAALLSFGLLLPWLLLRHLADGATETVRALIDHLSFDAQLSQLMRGVLELDALVFFASVIAFALFLTHRAVEAQRWT